MCCNIAGTLNNIEKYGNKGWQVSLFTNYRDINHVVMLFIQSIWMFYIQLWLIVTRKSDEVWVFTCYIWLSNALSVIHVYASYKNDVRE